jgi:hypothetical protein
MQRKLSNSDKLTNKQSIYTDAQVNKLANQSTTAFETACIISKDHKIL